VRRAWALPISIFALVWASTASAQGDPAAAAELFRQGRAALGQKDYATACPKFAESQRLDPKVGTLINLAQCEEATGKLASALRHWVDAQALAHSLGDGREAFVVHQHDAILPRVPHLLVRLTPAAPADTRITVDGSEVAPSDIGAPIAVDVGPHVILAESAGRADGRFDVSTSEGETAEVPVEPGAPLPSAPATSAAPASTTSTNLGPGNASLESSGGAVPAAGAASSSTQRWVAYGLGGLGIVGLGLGAAWGVQAINAKNEPGCQNGVCNSEAAAQVQRDGHDAGDRSTIAFIAGGALVAAGVVLWFTAPRGGDQSTGQAALSIDTSRTGVTCALRAAW